MINEKELLSRILSYDVETIEPKEIVIKYNLIKTKHGYTFAAIESVAHCSLDIYSEGASICFEPTHIISHEIIERIENGEEACIYPCETCIKEQKKTRRVDVDGVNLYFESAVDTPFIGKSIVFRTKLPLGLIRREVRCTRPGCTNNLVEFIEEKK